MTTCLLLTYLLFLDGDKQFRQADGAKYLVFGRLVVFYAGYSHTAVLLHIHNFLCVQLFIFVSSDKHNLIFQNNGNVYKI